MVEMGRYFSSTSSLRTLNLGGFCVRKDNTIAVNLIYIINGIVHVATALIIIIAVIMYNHLCIMLVVYRVAGFVCEVLILCELCEMPRVRTF